MSSMVGDLYGVPLLLHLYTFVYPVEAHRVMYIYIYQLSVISADIVAIKAPFVASREPTV